MDRRTFLQAAASAPAAVAATLHEDLPKYRVVSRFQPSAHPGMPGSYPGKVARVHAAKCIDEQSEKVDADTVHEMMAQGMRALTGDADARDSWARFFTPSDVVGIKVNCSGAPAIMSTPEVVAGIVRNLGAVGVKPEKIWIYERFRSQVDSVHYDRYVPAGVNIWTAEQSRGSIAGYDPGTYVDVNFFGEDDTRSNLARLVAEPLTKIINVPNMKDHGAAGVTGCLKNIAYGSFSNVARSHSGFKTNTYSFIGTLAAVEPLRSRTVLQIMDGLRGVWHGGPFSFRRKFRFYPKELMFGTDPVAVDRLLLDVIDGKRAAEHASSVWDRTMANVKTGRNPDDNPSINRFIREPGHIEYASKLGLGVYDIGKIQARKIDL
ncbi:MAG: DUF362 domain-containing protein [Acidobacteriia bacterium]|nr:DUF362 domain-containing protein [Terriglobia bacterium]